MNQNVVSQRLSAIIDYFAEGNEKRFADSLGVKPAVINNYTKGKQQSKPGFEVLNKIANYYPDVNVDWLLTGRGEMLKSDVDKLPKEKWIVTTQDTIGNKTIPLINRRAAANFLSGYQSQEYFEQLDAIQLPSSLLSGKQYYALQVSGDSMMPTLHDGDYVFCYRCDRTEWDYLKNGDVCVIASEPNGLQIKRIANKDNQNYITCLSDNFQRHPSFNLRHDEIAEIWKVTWKLSSWLENEGGGDIFSKLTALEARLERIEKSN